MQGEEHHHDIERIRIEDSRRVEQQASDKHVKGVVEVTDVFQIVLQPCHLVDQIDQQQVPQQSGSRSKHGTTDILHEHDFYILYHLLSKSSDATCKTALALFINSS